MTVNRRIFVQGTTVAATLGLSKLAFAADTIKIGYVSRRPARSRPSVRPTNGSSTR